MKLSKIATELKPSLTRQLFNMASQFDDTIDFTLGDPDYITPEHIREGGHFAIRNGRTKYSANAGILKLRQLISQSVFEETNVRYAPEHEVIVTVGAMEALYLSLLCLLDEGDEVIIPAPYWINYEHMVRMCKGIPVIISTTESNNFTVNIADVEKMITSRTKAIIINSPNNPSGIIYDYKTVEELSRLAKAHNILVYWDECYKSIVYDGNCVTSILEFEDMKEYAVIVNSFSKKYSMTGWRIGYALAPRIMVEAMTKLQENIVACAPLPSQYAAINALEIKSNCSEEMCLGFKERRDVLIEELNKIKRLSCNKPQGTFYAFVNIKKTGLSSLDFACQLLEKKHVAVVPGVTYGECCEGYIRIAYTVSMDKLKTGLKRIQEFVEDLD